MLQLSLQTFRLRWLRFLWTLFGSPLALKPGKGLQFSKTTGYLYGRKVGDWPRKRKPKALKSPPKGGSALPVPPKAPIGLSVEQAAEGLRRIANSEERKLLLHGKVDEVIARRTAAIWPAPRPDPKPPPGPLEVASLNERNGVTRLKRRNAPAMANHWLRRIGEHRKDFATRTWTSGKVSTEYEKGIVRPVWQELTKGVDVNEVHRLLRDDLAKCGLEVEFPAPYLATTWKL
jgi:hypothetical protein